MSDPEITVQSYKGSMITEARVHPDLQMPTDHTSHRTTDAMVPNVRDVLRRLVVEGSLTTTVETPPERIALAWLALQGFAQSAGQGGEWPGPFSWTYTPTDAGRAEARYD